MTPKTIFTIILKIFGIWLVLGMIQVIPQTLSAIPYILEADAISFGVGLFVMILALTFYFFIIRLLLFKTDFIIDKLSLDKHFDQEIVNTEIQQTTIIQIAIIVLGGILFIDNVPLLIKEIVSYLQQKQLAGTLFSNPSFQYIILHVGQLLLGYLLMNNSKRLTSWIDSIQKK